MGMIIRVAVGGIFRPASSCRRDGDLLVRVRLYFDFSFRPTVHLMVVLSQIRHNDKSLDSVERRMQERHDRGGYERGQYNKQGSMEE